MSKSISLICALITTFIWGTAFIAQDTGMDNIGPLTFNAARFFVGFVTVLPIAFLVERGKIIENINLDKKLFFKYLFLMSLSLFFGTFLQQTSLLYTNIANAAFFTVFYVFESLIAQPRNFLFNDPPASILRNFPFSEASTKSMGGGHL